jgi:hypothetical protein
VFRHGQDGDTVSVHYRGTLLDGGEQFDASYERQTPFDFTLGQGSVIRGWDLGVAGMCVGEKRKLKIPADLGYGERGSPPKIPGGASLVRAAAKRALPFAIPPSLKTHCRPFHDCAGVRRGAARN